MVGGKRKHHLRDFIYRVYDGYGDICAADFSEAGAVEDIAMAEAIGVKTIQRLRTRRFTKEFVLEFR